MKKYLIILLIFISFEIINAQQTYTLDKIYETTDKWETKQITEISGSLVFKNKGKLIILRVGTNSVNYIVEDWEKFDGNKFLFIIRNIKTDNQSSLIMDPDKGLATFYHYKNKDIAISYRIVNMYENNQ